MNSPHAKALANKVLKILNFAEATPEPSLAHMMASLREASHLAIIVRNQPTEVDNEEKKPEDIRLQTWQEDH